jgi:uncharacterized protein
MNRRHFFSHSIASAAALTIASASPAQTSTPPTPKKGTEPVRGPQLDAALVKEFVGAGHGNLPRVKELIAEQPKLVFCSYDWGAGDFETALGGASHVGRREIALHLLDAGARIDAFCAAMLGETAVVTALLRLSPATARTRGPHNYTLLYHAGYNGDVAIGEAIAAHLKDRAPDFNQALQTATLRGHADFVAWLLKNGVTNPNTKNFQKKTSLDLAVENGHEAIAKLLRENGGVTGG